MKTCSAAARVSVLAERQLRQSQARCGQAGAAGAWWRMEVWSSRGRGGRGRDREGEEV